MKSASRALKNFVYRPYEVLVALILIGVGIDDILTDGYPPELNAVTPDWLIHTYGIWVTVGSLLVIFGIFSRPETRARRVERIGHALTATGLAVLCVALLPTLRTMPTLIPDVVCAVVIALSSTGRYIYLGQAACLRRRITDLALED